MPSYGAMVLLGVAAGFALFFWDARREEQRLRLGPLAVAGLLGGALWAKALEFAFHAEAFAHGTWQAALFSGRTIVGGFVGGALAVAWARRRLGLAGRRGNLLAAPIALGLAIGRIGCFLGGCCYGTPTALPWGVDFGDGVPRHPTQLYEAAFALVALVALRVLRGRVSTPGRLFGGLMIAYFAFRFAEEFLRDEARVALGATPYQLAALVALVYFVWREVRGTAAPAPVTGGETT